MRYPIRGYPLGRYPTGGRTGRHPTERRLTALVGDSGVTLAEVLVATVVVSIGLIALGMTIPLSTYGVHEGHALSAATFLAEQKLEEIRSATWSSVGAGPGPEIDCLGTGASGPPTSTMCARSAPTACAVGSSCTTYPDEQAGQIPGDPTYTRVVRIWDCAGTMAEVAAGCAGVAHPDLRLVRVSVSYAPIAAATAIAPPAAKTATVEAILAKRR